VTITFADADNFQTPVINPAPASKAAKGLALRIVHQASGRDVRCAGTATHRPASRLQSDPIVYGGFKAPQRWSRIVEARHAIRCCQHFVIVTPCWCWACASLLKGFIDRVSTSPNIRKLLKGRSAPGTRRIRRSQWLCSLAGGVVLEEHVPRISRALRIRSIKLTRLTRDDCRSVQQELQGGVAMPTVAPYHDPHTCR
jgi:hypothetical protein